MDGEKYKKYYKPILSRYLKARKICFQCFTNDKEVWYDILDIVDNKNDLIRLKIIYQTNTEVVQSYYYLKQIFGMEKINDFGVDYQVDQRDVLFFAITQFLQKFSDKEILQSIKKYCVGKTYSQQFFFQFYRDFLTKIETESQVCGLTSFLESVRKKRQILDCFYFFVKYIQIK